MQLKSKWHKDYNAQMFFLGKGLLQTLSTGNVVKYYIDYVQMYQLCFKPLAIMRKTNQTHELQNLAII